MNRRQSLQVGAAVAMVLALASCAGQSGPGAAAEAGDPALLARVAQLEQRATRLDDINNIKRLQRSFGYYLDEGQWNDVADLFSDAATVEIGHDGVYRG
jgi:hypothetical protein